MSRPAARITHTEVTRLIKAVQACGLPIARVTFDGEKVEVVVGGEKSSRARHSAKPVRFETPEEWDAWRASLDEPGG
jgi:hypothetical protein